MFHSAELWLRRLKISERVFKERMKLSNKRRRLQNATNVEIIMVERPEWMFYERSEPSENVAQSRGSKPF